MTQPFQMKSVAILLGLLLACRGAVAQTAPAKDPGSLFDSVELNEDRITAGPEFVVPGEFSIATPTGGFEWKELQDAETEKLTGKWYTCMKPGHKAGIVLGIEMRTAESDAARLTTIAGHYNTLLTRIEQRGFTKPKVKKPSLKSPVADKIDYEIVAKTPAGKEAFMFGETIFGGRVFSFQIATESRKEAEELLEIVKTFKDLSPQVDKEMRGEVVSGEFVVPGQFSVAIPGIGYEWALIQTMDVKGATVSTYACAKDDSQSTVVLTVQAKPEESDAEQLVRKHFDLLRGQLKKAGFTDIQERAPDASVNGERVTFALRGKDPKGQITYLFGLTVLGRNLYTIHLISPSQDEARQLHKAISTFKELPAA